MGNNENSQVIKPARGSGSRGINIVPEDDPDLLYYDSRNHRNALFDSLTPAGKSTGIYVVEPYIASVKSSIMDPDELSRHGRIKRAHGSMRFEIHHAYNPVSKQSSILAESATIALGEGDLVHGSSSSILQPILFKS